jgi:hypothetical protein
MKTITVAVEMSVEEKVEPADVAEALFDYLVSAEDLPEIIFSIDGAEVRRF